MGQSAERLELEVGRVSWAGGAVGDGQVLDRDGVPVFETAVADPAAGQIPAPADRFNGFDRADIPLGQPVKRIRPAPAGDTSGSSSTRKSSGWHLSFIGRRLKARTVV